MPGVASRKKNESERERERMVEIRVSSKVEEMHIYSHCRVDGRKGKHSHFKQSLKYRKMQRLCEHEYFYALLLWENLYLFGLGRSV